MHQNYLGPTNLNMQSSRTGSPRQQQYTINKALEQKLIGPMEESHTEEQSPKTVWRMEFYTRRSKIAARTARTRARTME
jgi:hypothetical protein